MAEPILPISAPLKRQGAKGGRRSSLIFRANVRLNTSGIRDLRVKSGTSSQLQARSRHRQRIRTRF